MEKVDSYITKDERIHILDKILFELINGLDSYTDRAVFFDLHMQFKQKQSLIKDGKYNPSLINKAYFGIRKLRAKLSSRQKRFQKQEKREAVEYVLYNNEFTVGNFSWKVEIVDDEGPAKQELLINCLDSKEAFEAAIESDVIKVKKTIKIHDIITLDVRPLNNVLKDKIRLKQLGIYKSNIDLPDYTDDEKTDLITDYLRDLEDPDFAIYDRENSEAYLYFISEYLEELRSLTFRLYSVYYYFLQNNNDINNPEGYNDIDTIRYAIQYYYLEDNASNISIDDNYLREFEELPIFYKMYLGNLSNVLRDAILKYKKSGKKEPKANTDITIKDYKEEIKQLILRIKEHNNKKDSE